MRVSKILFSPKFLLVLVLLLSAQFTYADHLKGGWIKYTFNGVSNNKANYTVSFYQYSDCSEPQKVDGSIYLAIYDAGSMSEFTVLNISLTKLTTEEKSDFGPCFQNPPTVCYLVAEYTKQISLPLNASGYVLSVQRCCRIIGIANIPNSNTYGLTYTVTIPGGNNNNDNSPVFDFNETVAVCFNSPFTFDFSAKDIDGDSLVYSLCSGLTGGTQSEPVVQNPGPPPYETVPYLSPYSGAKPMGQSVSIDPQTGIVSGIAPSQIGTFVVAVCVDEYRAGKYIGHTRKELHINVSNCQFGGADLNPSYITCDGYNFTFKNKAGTNSNYSYYWDFGVTGISTDTSTAPTPTYIYPDTGTYTVKLVANNNKGCEDSAQTQVKIYPGFITDFSVNGSCIANPYSFKDLTTTKYGYVNTWKWFFGQDELVDDTTQNPFYTYADTGQKTVTLITTNSKGCIDTMTKILQIASGPDLFVNFKDTLICSIDTLVLQSSSTDKHAVFSWGPVYNIIGPGSNQPLVYPKTTTTYNVTVTDNGCVASDSVTVNVVDNVTLNLPPDTTICKTDSIQLSPSTNALYFSWSPPTGLSSASAQQPMAAPLSKTKYNLIASIGKCFTTGAITVDVAPYPIVNAGPDVSICYGKTTQLNASIQGNYFTWSPAAGLVNPNSLSTVAGPQSTTQYVLSATDTLGCPKPAYDTVVVNVVPKVIAFAGNDTSVVRNQPLQLNAKGATDYQWTPATDLSNPFIANPVATFTHAPDTVSYNVRVSTEEGCFANDSITIYIFETRPEAFIPSAFTPNGDGINDTYKPTVTGMKRFLYFRIYNRWGQLLFSTAEPNKGWDGLFKGKQQASGTYVYELEAVDYTDKPYFRKGTFVLIR